MSLTTSSQDQSHKVASSARSTKIPSSEMQGYVAAPYPRSVGIRRFKQHHQMSHPPKKMKIQPISMGYISGLVVGVVIGRAY
ncbi:hypothetical protein AKJ16_DCAP26733, partial [Drosera capensis]